MALQEQVAAVFAPNGPMAATVPDYRPRPGQWQMAEAVVQVMEDGGTLVVEAGTGVGKTYAYLVPALMSGRKVLVSTATKALQDQLFGRDIPRLRELLGVSLRVALLKGRSSYLCLHHIEHARQDARLNEPAVLRTLGRVETWSLATRTGDLAEVEALDESSILWPLLTSTRENCLGARCAHAARCFVNQARREALSADMVVINHHLFFADLNVRESGVAELLPSVHTVIFDEAHQLNEIGVQFLGMQLGTGQLSSFVRDLLLATQTHARGMADWSALAQRIEYGAQALRARFTAHEESRRIDWLATGPRWPELLQTLAEAMGRTGEALAQVEQSAPELQLLYQRASELGERLQRFMQPVPDDGVRWLEVGRQLRMFQAPLDISGAMQSRVLPTGPAGMGNKSWIFTSATLGQDAQLSWTVDSCGLQGARVLRVDSPFDYVAQAALFVPVNFPQPGEVGHSESVAALALEGALILNGRTLVLTTTLRAMRSIGDALRRALSGQQGLELLVQGEMPKRELLARFLSPASHSRAGAILVASATFWEGIDMPGEALQLLVIDKLPFAPPDDPVTEARARALQNAGKSPFKQLHLPQAAVALRQGAGRLIRRESDRGVLVICDVRLRQKGYGRQLIGQLPPMRSLADADEFRDALESLTRASTTDRSWNAPPW